MQRDATAAFFGGVSDSPKTRQLTLAEIGQGFEALGVAKADDLPEGVSALTARELRFVLGVLEHGQMAKAATDAGYSAESAGSIASETLRKPKVFAFYRRCLDKVANKGEQLVARVYERSVIYHARAIEAAQIRADADTWLLSKETHTSGEKANTKREYELTRERAQRDEKHYATLANQTDALLGTLLGKIGGVHLSGTIQHEHSGQVGVSVTVPAEALPGLAAARRDVLIARRDGVLPLSGGTN